MQTRLILALDVDDIKEVERLVIGLKEFVGYFKIGMRLFFRYGPRIVSFVKQKGGEVFLDAKLHDIPSVVEAACKIIGKMGVGMLTVHTLGGVQMMQRAAEAVKKENRETKVLGVTLLTSIDQRILKDELGIQKPVKEQVLHLAHKAQNAGLDGVVCSGEEVEILRENLGKNFLLVVPGIRIDKVEADEQKRILTPKEAIHRGASYLVVGRPILRASDPIKVARKILEEI